MAQLYEVTYDVFTEPRTDTFLGSTNTNLMNLKTRVLANGPNQAQQIVEAQNGGTSFCQAKSAYPVS